MKHRAANPTLSPKSVEPLLQGPWTRLLADPINK